MPLSSAARPLPRKPGRWFLPALALGLLTAISLYLALLATMHTPADVERLNHITFDDGTSHALLVHLSARQLAAARAGALLLLGGTAASLFYLLRRRPHVRAELRQLGREIAQAGRGLGAVWRRLTRPQRWTAGVLFGLLLAVRLYCLLYYRLFFDEVTSFNLFVREGLVAVSSYYPIPNNHILSNLLSWVFYQVNSNFYWAVRVPVFLTSALGTALLYLGLLRISSFTVATLALGLYCFTPNGLDHSFEGRGYFLLVCCAGVGFLAALEVLRNGRYQRLSWALLVLSSIVGFYTIPTFLYPFLSLNVVLGGTFLWRRQGAPLRLLVGTDVVVAACSVLLYLPVLTVSGGHALTGNQFVAPSTAQAFWARIGPHAHYVAGLALGQERVGLWLDGVLLAGVVALTWGTRDRLVRAVAWPALAYALLPFLWLTLQQVLPPGRVLSYRLLFLFVAAGVLLDFVNRRLALSAYPRLALLGVSILCYGAYQLHHLRGRQEPRHTQNAQAYRTYQWLAAHRARRVLAVYGDYAPILYHYARQDHNPLEVDSRPHPHARYDYVLLDRHASPGPDSARVVAYPDAFVQVLRP